MNEVLSPRELCERVTSRAGYTSMVGTRVVHAEAGCVHLGLDRRDDLLQFTGTYHGGVIAGLIDHAAGGAATTSLPPGHMVVTIDLHVNFLAPAKGHALLAKARVVPAGKKVLVSQVDVWALDGSQEHLCAMGTATLRAVELAVPA